MTSIDPLRELWAMSIDRTGMEVIFEFMALANHRPAIRKEIARANERTRSMQAAMLTRALEERGIPPEVCPPHVLSVLIAGVARAVVSEAAIGVSSAHADTVAFVERLIQKSDRSHLSEKPGEMAGARSVAKAGGRRGRA